MDVVPLGLTHRSYSITKDRKQLELLLDAVKNYHKSFGMVANVVDNSFLDTARQIPGDFESYLPKYKTWTPTKCFSN